MHPIITTPDLIAAIPPGLIGFVPTESILLIGITAEKVQIAARHDITGAADVADYLAEVLHTNKMNHPGFVPPPLWAGPRGRGQSSGAFRTRSGGDLADTRVQPAVVVPVDPTSGRELDVGDGLVRAGVEDRGPDAVGLVQPAYRLGQSVVVASPPDPIDAAMSSSRNRSVSVADVY